MGYISMNSTNLIRPYEGTELNDAGRKYKKIGERLLREKKLGVVILSGGQGTRLGSDEPKGLFKIKGKTLFEWHMETIKELISKYNADIAVFIMTSSFTDEAVRKYFQSTDFGLKIQFFKQRNSLCVGTDGKPLEWYDGHAESPYGNGDIFNAIQQVNLEGIEALNVICIDNVLAKILDPVFVGAFYSDDYDILSKSVTKEEKESVGAFLMDERLKIKEYSENDAKGEGIQGNICNHIFKTSFIKKMKNINLPEHKAFKKIPYTISGKLIKPVKPNGFKKETFIFDSFEYTQKNGVMNVPREKEFSPLKNGMDSSVDNPVTCTIAVERHRIKTTIQ
ncbi:UDP-N-ACETYLGLUCOSAMINE PYROPHOSPHORYLASE [Encephalitozoon cuniculi GB-M1]|uniref:Probable UDP-N-acetylglucosamine pyrophosphorylase n=2 Tax=Encephalitozoon cuniculi TaxID=6035 RepID=UAP1_ENCCU|nr:UDP-N-acetylglucosamine diphosphorylase [Encephalitozoon cuniculi GB-M1]Q8SQS1.1 RecName: Full=Probable UDP-N-acetylglucosamine pyrophosphorylase [Encephalitozoon cuniculi GB-M1]AGE94910.1 UDP-n-acetylglucosamine pyrophosphorylase [Encephalitozoon cuniculi]KMV65136.1 UDP-N-acetylglucosamine pyrophosphorylase [Encephalitozoon cuniculi EcunIII-L]UYI26387.1 UDP-N-acetylglucosamine pyrophosphorylase [Encephalitozoon cuniculi]CAD26088.1 UDP-N-ACETYLGLUCOSAMINE PYROPHOSPHORYLASE [Encephalitozoon 